MPDKVRWGVLGVANFAVTKFIPAFRQCELAVVDGIASRDLARAQRTASELGISKAYGSYEELLADPEIDVVYNPLPNHLHVPWSIRAAEAGKHVLCEKPVALDAAEARELLAARDRTGVLIGEGFMVRTHPQWVRARELVAAGEIGQVRAISTFFSYNNRNPKNIRNIASTGGGSLYDIGCYAIQTARYVYAAEPRRAAATLERDPEMGIDRLASAILEFPSGHAIFTVSTQVLPYQRVQIVGTQGRIEIEIPFNPPPGRAARLWVDATGDLARSGVRSEEFAVCDQYSIQADEFSRAVKRGGPAPTPLEDSVANMAAIDAVFRAAASGRWETVG